MCAKAESIEYAMNKSSEVVRRRRRICYQKHKIVRHLDDCRAATVAFYNKFNKLKT